MRYKAIQGGFFPGENNALSNLISPSVTLNSTFRTAFSHLPRRCRGPFRHSMSGPRLTPYFFSFLAFFCGYSLGFAFPFSFAPLRLCVFALRGHGRPPAVGPHVRTAICQRTRAMLCANGVGTHVPRSHFRPACGTERALLCPHPRGLSQPMPTFIARSAPDAGDYRTHLPAIQIFRKKIVARSVTAPFPSDCHKNIVTFLHQRHLPHLTFMRHRASADRSSVR